MEQVGLGKYPSESETLGEGSQSLGRLDCRNPDALSNQGIADPVKQPPLDTANRPLSMDWLPALSPTV